MFAAAQLMVLNKVDLLPHLEFDVERCIAYAKRVNPAIEVLQVSATRGHGMNAWLDWLIARLAVPAAPAAHAVQAVPAAASEPPAAQAAGQGG
jgi:hydrogenase nickel incorporation protein HypB